MQWAHPPAPLGQTTTEVDALSRPVAVTDGKGQRTTYDWDVLDRLTAVTFADGTAVTYGYDAVGNRTSQTDPTGTTTTTYDALYRIVDESLSSARGTNSYLYDGVGNLVSLSDTAGTTTYAYNAVNLLTSLTEPGGQVTTFGYDDANNRTSTTYPNAVTQRGTFDASNRLTRITASGPGGTYTDFAYSYTTTGGGDAVLRQSVTDLAGETTTYSYDAADRLTGAVTRDGAGSVVNDHAYGYDPASNRTTETVNGVTKSATFNAANQLTARGGVSYSYDANGNLTGSSADLALGHNAADQTTSLTHPTGGNPITAAYAGPDQFALRDLGADVLRPTILGITARSVDTRTDTYMRDTSGGLVGRNVPGHGRYYYLFDAQGSVVALTTENGNLERQYDYDPFGVTTAPYSYDSNPWRYKSRYQDEETDLYKIGLHYYQPDLGRCAQSDPVERVLRNDFPPEVNRYSYVGANPINYVDPSGACSALEWAGIAGFGAAAVLSGGYAPLLVSGSLAAFGVGYCTA